MKSLQRPIGFPIGSFSDIMRVRAAHIIPGQIEKPRLSIQKQDSIFPAMYTKLRRKALVLA